MAKNTKVLARNLISGVVDEVPASYLNHSVFGKQLEKVEEGAKSFVPELYKPKTKNEKGDKVPVKTEAPKPADAEVEKTSDTENR